MLVSVSVAPLTPGLRGAWSMAVGALFRKGGGRRRLKRRDALPATKAAAAAGARHGGAARCARGAVEGHGVVEVAVPLHLKQFFCGVGMAPARQSQACA